MSDKSKVNKNATPVEDKAIGEESLAPQKVRIFGKTSWVMAWAGNSIFIGAFIAGGSLVPPAGQLNLLQALICMVFACSLIPIGLALNGRAGNQDGIPFVAQIRPIFGMSGSIFPMLLRAIPAICWYGIQSWVGATALNQIFTQLAGMPYNFTTNLIFFIIFQGVQIWLSAGGFKGIKWLEIIGVSIIAVSLFYMLYVIISTYGAQLNENLINIKGTWGMPFWAGTTVFLGMYTTLILNGSDYSREVKEFKKRPTWNLFGLQWLGIVPPVLLMSLIGLLSANITGQFDPIILFVEVMQNKVMLIIALLFIMLAQITTNVMANVIPPSYVMMDLFKIKYKPASIITGLIALLTFPWILSTSGGFSFFIQFYSAFMGPIFACMIVDYFLLRKKTFNLDILYEKKGPYKGVNWNGIIAIVVGAAVGLIVIEISYYLSLIPAGLVYYLLMKRQIKIGGRFAAGIPTVQAVEAKAD